MSPRTKYLLTVGAVIAFMLVALSARGHDHSRPDLNGWFHKLHSKGGTWCCDGPGKDALHLKDADWETRGGRYRVRVPVDQASFERALKGETVQTEWADVPDDAVIAEPNKYGTALVWPTYGVAGRMVRCFMPGVET
jgi:hypothetical protein